MEASTEWKMEGVGGGLTLQFHTPIFRDFMFGAGLGHKSDLSSATRLQDI